MSDDHALQPWVSIRNLARQYDFMSSSFVIWRAQSKPDLSLRFIAELNFYAVHYLSPAPGATRDVVKGNVDIDNAPHTPPDFSEISGLMSQFLEQLSRMVGNGQPVEAAAYALWRLNWIHPFMQGNGRTARALSYFVLCQEMDVWLPGGPIVPEQIRNTRPEYYALLREADSKMSDNQLTDLTNLAVYLTGLLKNQLAPIPDGAAKASPG